jgi:hypothetical protein
MDHALVAVAETLAGEFDQLPSTTVVRVVTDSVAEYPDADHMFVEQAARARLSELADDPGTANDE